MKKLTTNCKEVKEQIRKHILEFMNVEDLKTNAQTLIDKHNPTIYHAVKKMVEGGYFLCYYEDVNNFLNGLGINSENKEYSNEKSWELYVHLIARDSVLLIKHA